MQNNLISAYEKRANHIKKARLNNSTFGKETNLLCSEWMAREVRLLRLFIDMIYPYYTE